MHILKLDAHSQVLENAHADVSHQNVSGQLPTQPKIHRPSPEAALFRADELLQLESCGGRNEGHGSVSSLTDSSIQVTLWLS
jgi:hypothetical protein